MASQDQTVTAEQKTNSDNHAQESEEPGKPPIYKRRAFLISAAVVLLILLIGGTIYWLHQRKYEATDDAYVDGHVTQIGPQVAAPVLRLHIRDNMLVHQGDLMVELDPTDFEVALNQANAEVAAGEGRLAQAQAQVTASQDAVKQSNAEVTAAQVALENTSRDLQRYETVDPHARSQQQLDNAIAAHKNAQAQLDQAKARLASAQANVTTSVAAVKAAEGDLQRFQSDVQRAKVNLGYCHIIAPSTGRVTQRTVENGTYVTVGQPMFSLVSPDVWVTANFKENQLTYMKPGQSVTISVDAYPNRNFQGHVDSIQAGSGSRFSMLPAENATGNFVKIVQRVPVKILFDHGPNTSDTDLLSPGLSVEPNVKVRD